MDDEAGVALVDAVDNAITAMYGAAAALTDRGECPKELALFVARALEKCADELAQAARDAA